jgi:hypothetical protein
VATPGFLLATFFPAQGFYPNPFSLEHVVQHIQV